MQEPDDGDDDDGRGYPKPQTPNPKLQTSDPKPQTPSFNRSLRQLRFLFGHTFWTIKARGKPSWQRPRRRRPSPKKIKKTGFKLSTTRAAETQAESPLATGTGYKWTGLQTTTTKDSKKWEKNKNKWKKKFQAKNLRAGAQPESSARPPVNGTQPRQARQAGSQPVGQAGRHHTEFGGNDSGTCSCSGSRRQSPKNRQLWRSLQRWLTKS